MSNNITSPWIYEYFLSVAETHGGDLQSVPSHDKRAVNAQIVKWLSHHRDERDDSHIWALLSDKMHEVHVRFSKEAVQFHKQVSVFRQRPLTEYRSALVTLNKFRPFLGRVPVGDDKGLTPEATLALEADFFCLKGAFNQEKWGAPRLIEADERIREWIEGLRVSGGGGNILKLRKQEREQATSNTDQNGVTATREHEIVAERSWYSPPKGLLTSSRTQVSSKVNVTSNPDTPPKDTETRVLATHVPNSPCIIASRERIKKWRSNWVVASKVAPPREIMSADVPWFALDEDDNLFGEHLEVESVLRGHTSSTPVCVTPARTPSQWSPSVGGRSPASSPNLQEWFVLDPSQDTHSENEGSESSFQLLEREDDDGTKQDGHGDVSLDVDQPVAYSPSPSYPSAPGLAQWPEDLPSSLLARASSPPLPSAPYSSSAPELPRRLPLPRAVQPPVVRRVPLPRAVVPLVSKPDRSGPGRILVPCSDSSGMASQSQRTQSQSQNPTTQQSVAQSLKGPNSEGYSQLRHEVEVLAEVKEEGPVIFQSLTDVDGLSADAGQDSLAITCHAETTQAFQSAGLDDALDEEQEQMSTDGDADDEDDADEVGEDGTQPALDDLDSDDARTKTMVDMYDDGAQEYSKGKQRADLQDHPTVRSADEPRSNLDTTHSVALSPLISLRTSTPTRSHGSDGPILPSSPDVFTDADTIDTALKLVRRSASPTKEISDFSARPGLPHNANDEVGPPRHHPPADRGSDESSAMTQQPLHDADSWKAPSFMRQPNGRHHQRQEAPTTTVSLPQKRVISIPSSPEGPPPKKLKARATALVARLSSNGANDTRTATATHAGDTSITVPNPDRSIPPVRHIDLQRSLSRLSVSSRASSRAPWGGRATSLASTSSSSLVPPISEMAVSHILTKSREFVDSWTIRNYPTDKYSPLDKKTSRQLLSHDEEAAPTSAGSVMTNRLTLPKAKILNGYDHRIELRREEGGPPLPNFHDLADILCRTGRLRYKHKHSA